LRGRKVVEVVMNESVAGLCVDMINMIKADFVPLTCEWIHHAGDAVQAIAVTDEASGTIYVYDGRQDGNEPFKILDSIHRNPVTIIRYNPVYDAIISADNKGIIEYWTGPKNDYQLPRSVRFDSKLDTDLFEFVKDKLVIHSICLSPNGRLFAALTSNKKVKQKNNMS
jgi:peptidylprolyl isomerase domain and WD repeat-containing protein 1